MVAAVAVVVVARDSGISLGYDCYARVYTPPVPVWHEVVRAGGAVVGLGLGLRRAPSLIYSVPWCGWGMAAIGGGVGGWKWRCLRRSK